jgi:hypothetical protein
VGLARQKNRIICGSNGLLSVKSVFIRGKKTIESRP